VLLAKVGDRVPVESDNPDRVESVESAVHCAYKVTVPYGEAGV
jgi:hypothetical protein